MVKLESILPWPSFCGQGTDCTLWTGWMCDHKFHRFLEGLFDKVHPGLHSALPKNGESIEGSASHTGVISSYCSCGGIQHCIMELYWLCETRWCFYMSLLWWPLTNICLVFTWHNHQSSSGWITHDASAITLDAAIITHKTPLDNECMTRAG